MTMFLTFLGICAVLAAIMGSERDKENKELLALIEAEKNPIVKQQKYEKFAKLRQLQIKNNCLDIYEQDVLKQAIRA